MNTALNFTKPAFPKRRGDATPAAEIDPARTAVGGRPHWFGIAVALLVCCVAGCSRGSTPAAQQTSTVGGETAAAAGNGELTLAFIPQENPEKLIGDIEVITDYLRKELERPVRGFVSQDHAAAVEAMRNGDADVTFMGGLPYVLAHHLIGAEVLLAEVYRGSPTYRGRIFVRRDSGIEKIEQLRDRTMAFADPISESGYLFPLDIFARAGLLAAGQDAKDFFREIYFAGGYQQAVQAVANGHVDAAGSSQFAELLLTPDQLEQITWIAESELIPSHCVVVRKGLDSTLVENLRASLLRLNEPDHRYLLAHLYGPDGYVETSHDDYLVVETMAKKYGLFPDAR